MGFALSSHKTNTELNSVLSQPQTPVKLVGLEAVTIDPVKEDPSLADCRISDVVFF